MFLHLSRGQTTQQAFASLCPCCRNCSVKSPGLCYNGGQSGAEYPLLALKPMNNIFPWRLQPGCSGKSCSYTWAMDSGWIRPRCTDGQTGYIPLLQLHPQPCGITAAKPPRAGMAPCESALARWFSIQNLEFIEDSSFVTSSIRGRHHRDGRGKKIKNLFIAQLALGMF